MPDTQHMANRTSLYCWPHNIWNLPDEPVNTSATAVQYLKYARVLHVVAQSGYPSCWQHIMICLQKTDHETMLEPAVQQTPIQEIPDSPVKNHENNCSADDVQHDKFFLVEEAFLVELVAERPLGLYHHHHVHIPTKSRVRVSVAFIHLQPLCCYMWLLHEICDSLEVSLQIPVTHCLKHRHAPGRLTHQELLPSNSVCSQWSCWNSLLQPQHACYTSQVTR